MKTIKSKMNEPLDSNKWLHIQKRWVWLRINDIPGDIFWSVWERIEGKGFRLHESKSLYMID